MSRTVDGDVDTSTPRILELREIRPPVDRRRRLQSLSRRERQVLALMAEGLSNQAVSKRLSLALKTVDSHVRSIFAKLDLPPSPAWHRRVLAVVVYLGYGTG